MSGSESVRNVTSRRRGRRKRSTDSEDSDCTTGSPSISSKLVELDPVKRKQLHEERQARNTVLLERARKVAEARQAEQEKNQETQSSIVAQLLNAQKQSKIALTNCFEQRTVLDVIDKSCVDRETISDMAVAIDAASTVYGYRVDKTHLDAQETSVNFTKSIAENSPKKRGGEDEESSPLAKKSKKKADQDSDLQARLQDIMEGHERSIVYDDDKESSESESDHNSEDDESLDLRSDVREQLELIKNRRQKKASKFKWRNRMLEEDEDKLCMTMTETHDNDYYQQAISKHNDQNANSLLLNNARSSGNGRLLFMHNHIEQDDIPSSTDCSIEFVQGIHDCLANALSANFLRPEGDLLPPPDICQSSLFIRTGELERNEQDEDDYEVLSDIAPTSEENLLDMTELPDRTIMETTMAPNMTIFQPNSAKKKEKQKSNKIRGRDIKEMWMPDKLSLPVRSRPDFNNMRRVAAHRLENGIPKKRSLITSEEFIVSPDDLWNDIKYAEFAGFDTDFRDIDCLWNSKLVQATITDEEAEIRLREAEIHGGTNEEILVRKRKVLPPGKYLFFVESEDRPLNIPADPWVEEGDLVSRYDISSQSQEPELDSFDVGSNYDDTFCGDDMTMNDDEPATPKAAAPSDQFLNNLMDADRSGDENNAPSLDAPGDDVADVAIDVPLLDSDEALKSLGKLDDAHWKANQQAPEKKERTKKDKNKDEQKSDEHYFVLSSEVDRLEAEFRFKMGKPSNFEKSEDSLFMKKKIPEKRPYSIAYDFENFTKSALIFEGRYGGIRFQRSMPVNVDDDAFNQGIPGNLDVDESDIEDTCREWLATFGGFRLYSEDEASENGDDEPAGDANENGNDDDGGNAFDDDVNDANDFAQPFAPLNFDPEEIRKLAERREAHDQVMNEFKALQSDDDSDEDESETVFIMEKKVTIMNTNIDQSRVKAYMREILTCPWMSAEKLKKKAEELTEPNNDIDDAAQEVNSVSNPDAEEGRNTEENSEIIHAVFGPPQDLSQQDLLKKTSTIFGDGSSGQVTSGVIVSDFKIDGVHSMSSLAAILPNRVSRKAEKNMHVAFAFSIALQMCNENMLHLSQQRPDGEQTGHTEDWMGDFFVRNATPPPGTAHNEN